MRPYVYSASPVTSLTTGFATNVTGATWTLTNTATNDSLGHLVTILNNSATDHSAKTAVITGTDVDGHSQTETVNLPAGSATVTGTKYFKTVTTIVPSATIGADTMNLGWGAVSVTPSFVLDRFANVGATIMTDISGTINFTGEETFNPMQSQTAFPSNNNTWFTMSGLSAKTADTVSSCTLGAVGVRIKTNSVTNGATLSIVINQPTFVTQ